MFFFVILSFTFTSNCIIGILYEVWCFKCVYGIHVKWITKRFKISKNCSQAEFTDFSYFLDFHRVSDFSMGPSYTLVSSRSIKNNHHGSCSSQRTPNRSKRSKAGVVWWSLWLSPVLHSFQLISASCIGVCNMNLGPRGMQLVSEVLSLSLWSLTNHLDLQTHSSVSSLSF